MEHQLHEISYPAMILGAGTRDIARVGEVDFRSSLLCILLAVRCKCYACLITRIGETGTDTEKQFTYSESEEENE